VVGEGEPSGWTSSGRDWAHVEEEEPEANLPDCRRPSKALVLEEWRPWRRQAAGEEPVQDPLPIPTNSQLDCRPEAEGR